MNMLINIGRKCNIFIFNASFNGKAIVFGSNAGLKSYLNYKERCTWNLEVINEIIKPDFPQLGFYGLSKEKSNDSNDQRNKAELSIQKKNVQISKIPFLYAIEGNKVPEFCGLDNVLFKINQSDKRLKGILHINPINFLYINQVMLHNGNNKSFWISGHFIQSEIQAFTLNMTIAFTNINVWKCAA